MLGNVLKVWGVMALVAFVAQPVDSAHAQGAKPATYATVKVEALNVRAAANKEAEKVGQLKKGDLVPAAKSKDGWVKLAWSKKAYVFQEGIDLPEGKLQKKPKYDDAREQFIDYARAQDKTIQWLEVPRATGIMVRYHWREYRDRAALIKRAEELARVYSNMTHGETGIEVEIVSGNETWGKAFY